jgi:hypothetical protein
LLQTVSADNKSIAIKRRQALRSQHDVFNKKERETGMTMKRTALFFASTAILFSSPLAIAEQAPLKRPLISSNSNIPPRMQAQAEQATHNATTKGATTRQAPRTLS